jgi:signal peptidase I
MSGTPARAWTAALLRVAAVLLLAVLTGLTVAALAPQTVGLSAHVVVSGSMAPRVQAGDVVLTQPVSPAELRPGQVLLFDDPQRPGGLLLHRLVSFDAAGHLVTRGDANQSDDSVHVPPAAVQGLATLRVPWIGLPAQWRAEGRYGAIALAAATLAGAAVLASSGWPRRSGVPAGARPHHTGGRHRSSPGTAQPMSAGRPSAVTRAPAEGIGTSTGRRNRASTPVHRSSSLPAAALPRRNGRRPGAGGAAGPRLRPAVAHDDCFDGGRYCGQPAR